MRILLLTLAMAAPICAQTLTPWSEGPLLGAPSLFTLDTKSPYGPSGEHAAEGYYKEAGVSSKGPGPLKFSMLPDFSAAALFRKCKGAPITSGPLPDIDAQSLGLDVLLIDEKGHVVQPRGRWAGLMFSVRRGTKGKSGRIAFESKGNGAESDFFHYVYRGSDCIPPQFVGRALKGNDAGEIALPTGCDVDGLDVYAALYARGLAARLGLPDKPTLYFSLEGSSANLSLCPARWWGAVPRSGAAVLKSTWDGTQWSSPGVAYSAKELGFCDDEDVDALALDLVRGLMVVSTDPAIRSASCPARDPLLYLRLGKDFAVPLPLIYFGGLRVSIDMGLDVATPQIDDIDAVCGLDPACGDRTNGIPLERALGEPWVAPFTPSLPPLETQGWREGGQGPHRYWLGMHGARPGSVALWYLSVPTQWPFLLIPMDQALSVPFSSPFLGSPVGPRYLQIPAAIRRYDVIVQWLSLDLRAPHRLHMAPPLRFRGP